MLFGAIFFIWGRILKVLAHIIIKRKKSSDINYGENAHNIICRNLHHRNKEIKFMSYNDRIFTWPIKTHTK